MQQQMSSPTCAQPGEVATLVRSFEGRLCGSTAAEDLQAFLPECKTRRNYSCGKCTYHTRNSRDYLLHIRDAHFEKIKIYGCPHCVYASKHHQKIVRHMKVHQGPMSELCIKMESAPASPSMDSISEPIERIEDYLEEVEEGEDEPLDLDDFIEESVECDSDSEKTNTEEPAPMQSSKEKVKCFSCNKCNYVTHIKGRFTKHVKYHSMPMIKCTMCDFRTPYKWNLDRHNKNHGGTGSFHCSMCNFTADIKQSLTVHEMNHHTPPVGQSNASRRRNRVGASDATALADVPAARVPKEDEGSGDSRSSQSTSDMGLQFAERDIVNCNSDSNDATSSEPGAKRDDSNLAQDGRNQQSPTTMLDGIKSQKQNRKKARPLPPLIPLSASTPNQNKTGEPPQKKLKETIETGDLNQLKRYENLPVDITLIPVNNAVSITKEVSRKKNNSFFDKLKERLLTETGEEGSLKCKNCGFESKCLSEHSVHEKTCSPLSNRIAPNAPVASLSSTRCQNCRHRCKSSADLYIHMQTCKKSSNLEIEQITESKKDDNEISSPNINKDTSTKQEDAQPHPMENVVFVWNNISNDSNKFELPLDIRINDDSTMPEVHRSFDHEVTDDNEGLNLSPSQAAGKKVFKCPHCPFWASTASRFHVHIVGHLNKKPFECSLCKYKSNWRWDITKHIKLKSARDPEHNEAKVLMTDETGRRNYSKYNKFLAMPILNENGENEFHYIDPNTTVDAAMEIDESVNDGNDSNNVGFEIPLNLQTQHSDQNNDNRDEIKKPKKTLWKCKKCNYKDPSKEALLEHVREHSRADNGDDKSKKGETTDPADLAYRCGHCNQLSNWKHVIQRHCRLKHDGIIKVITTVKPKPENMSANDLNGDTCPNCPFKTTDKKSLLTHVQQHQPSPQSIFKCFFCQFFVKDEQELAQHLALHGVTDAEDYITKTVGGKIPIQKMLPQQQQGLTNTSGTLNTTTISTKRHKCIECPYETNSKSQYMYHEQFHRLSADTPYKCPECNYSVSKRHLLHQHLRVHGIITKKNELDGDLDATGPNSKAEVKTEYPVLEDNPYVWVSAKNEFHKMYKCRYCSYVNSQKCKLPFHEKIHLTVFENNDITIYKCLECKFTIDNAGRLAEHSKTHGEIYGRIYCPVEEGVPDEEQIAKLRKVIENEKANATEDLPREEIGLECREVKLLYFCQKCPSRFFTDSELKNHDKFHDLSFTFKCKSCEFSVPQDSEFKVHVFVHSDEYNTKTKMLKFMHSSHPAYKEPQLELVHCPSTSDITWIVSNPRKNFDDFCNKRLNEFKPTPKQYCCNECPAKFFKSSTLTQHMELHGGDGEHKCKKCSYAVKNVRNLSKHELLHENEGKNCDYDSCDDMDYKNIPLSGTDLFQRKTEAQKRVLTDKDKLVKPNDHFPPVLQADPQFGYLMHGNPEFIYPTYLKNGRQKEKRYKCHKCPSAFEKREQYKIHLSLHGSKQRYKCELCDYSVKYYANYVQHMRKHQMNDEAQAERKKDTNEFGEPETREEKHEADVDHVKLAIKTMPKCAPKSDFQQYSISDQQTLRLLQRRRSLNSGKDISPTDQVPHKDRKMHMCLLCPYTNQRLDALNNHYRRHDDSDALTSGNHKCPHCDLVVVQSHFLREHLKTHFMYQKTLNPECYVANQNVSFTITKIDEENISSDLKLDMKNVSLNCNEEKLFVSLKTGEIVVE